MSGRRKKALSVEKSTGTVVALDLYREARDLWLMDLAFDPKSSLADMYNEVLEHERRILHQKAQPEERT